MNKCYKCGNEYPDDYRFCPRDGVAISALAEESSRDLIAPAEPEAPARRQISLRALLAGLGILAATAVLAFSVAFFYLYLKPKYGGLEVKTTPPDATVYLDGKQVGASPLKLENLRSGQHQIRVVKEGYVELVQSVQVVPYATDQLHWSLEPLVPQLTNEQLAEIEGLKKKLESALKENILLPPPDDYNVLHFARKILEIDPANAYAADVKNKLAEDIQQNADAAYAREDWLEAEKQYRNLAVIFPDDPSVNERLADIGQKIDESIKDHERSIAELTAKVETALKAGVLLPPEKDNALDSIRSIQRLDRRNAYARSAMAQLREALQTRGDSKMNAGDWIGARNQYRQVLQYFPDDNYSKSRLEQAEVKVAEGARAEQARLEALQEEQRSQQELENLHRAAIGAFQAGDYAKSLSLWQAFLKREPGAAEPYFYLGAIYLEQKQLDTAILNFERCVAQNADNALAHLNLGILYDQHRNDPIRSMEHFRKVLDLGGVDRYTPERLRAMIQDLEDRIELAVLEKKSYAVEHKHAFSSCRGQLRVTSQGIEFRTSETDHSLYEAWSRIGAWSVDGDEVSIRLANNRRYNFRLLNPGEAGAVRRLMARRRSTPR